MRDSTFVVPLKQLPPGYARSLGPPPDPPTIPRPAATLMLLRDGGGGLEVLLLERSSRTRFIPGAYVFPGGRVDPTDASPHLHSSLKGLSPGDASTRMAITPDEPSAAAYIVAALRETFEETGVLLEAGPGKSRSIPMSGEGKESRMREEMHRGKRGFSSVLKELGSTLEVGGVRYIGHWVTPVQERYRYDTRFFATEVPPTCAVFPDGVEMVGSLWLTPLEALDRNRQGRLPLVFPTLVTLESLESHTSPRAALKVLGEREVPRLLPWLEETGDGVRVTLEPTRPSAQSVV